MVEPALSGSSGYKRYVGIWYKWDKRTVVWIANRDDPLVNPNGTFGRYWIRVVGRFTGIGKMIIGVICVQMQT